MTFPLPCAGAPGCTIPPGEVVTFLGRTYCARHALPAVAEALAMQRRLAGSDLFDALDILRGAIVGIQLRLRVLGIDSRPAEVERAS